MISSAGRNAPEKRRAAGFPPRPIRRSPPAPPAARRTTAVLQVSSHDSSVGPFPRRRRALKQGARDQVVQSRLVTGLPEKRGDVRPMTQLVSDGLKNHLATAYDPRVRTE